MADEFQGIAKPQRWDVPFSLEQPGSGAGLSSPPMTEADVQHVLTHAPFSKMDPDRFPESTPLEGILLNDSRICRFQRGQIIVRQGDYGSSAFFILSGVARVILEKLDETLIGHGVTRRRTVFEALRQLWSNPTQPEVRHYASTEHDPHSQSAGSSAIFIQDVTAIFGKYRHDDMGAGEMFGELAALTRTPRTATIIAEQSCELLEIRWQGLREMRLRSTELKAHIDQLYRERSLKSHLRETPMFSHLSPEKLEKVAAATELQTYGHFDWHTSHKKAGTLSPVEQLRLEPVIAQQGHYPNGVLLIRSGFARISQTYNNGERTISYLGRGQTFGFEEIAHNWRATNPVALQSTLRAVGFVDVLFVPTKVIEEYVLATTPETKLPQLSPEPTGRDTLALASDVTGRLQPEMLEFLVEKRFINGTATMIIDLERCTRCDDCVRACAAAHNNNPRFVRHGPTQGRFMIANACMHCQDPVCMIGCPTGAIHRNSAEGQVVINDQTCIGCATCANSCPYDNIQMVHVRDPDGNLYFDQASHQPIQKAAKCDLCIDQLQGVGPACANACPHDAMIRVDMRDLNTLTHWLDR